MAFCKVCEGAIVGRRKGAAYCSPKCYKRADYERERDKGLRQSRRIQHRSEHSCNAAQMFWRIKDRAKRNGTDFNVTLEYVRDLCQVEVCAVTGIPFDYSETHHMWRPFAPSIDRIDCTKGYIKGNIRIVCVMVNLAINQFGEDAFMRMCIAAANIHSAKSLADMDGIL
jgi:hypothetical protein